jgi:tetratricopeptide (TPR) repeat protein
MRASNNRRNNALFIYHFLSSGEVISIDKEIFFNNKSLYAIKRAFKTAFPFENRVIRKSEVTSVLNLLAKEGFIVETGKLLKIKASENYKKTPKETESFGQYLSDVLPDNPENNASWYTFSGLAQLTTTYLKTYNSGKEKSQQLISIAERFVQCLIYSGQNKKALQIIKLISKTIQSLPDKPYHRAIFTAYKAEIFRMKGKNGAAEKLLRPTIRRLEKHATQYQVVLAQLHALLGLVLLYDDKLRFSEAESYLQKALVIRQINLGEKHILTISALLYLAEYYVQMGMAGKVFGYVKSANRYLASYNNKYYEAWANDIFGLASYFAGNGTDALTYCEKGLLARRQFLQKGHPLLLESQHNVGYLLLLTGKPTEAIEYLNQTYADFKKAYTPEHQNYTVTVGVIALCNLALNKIETAENILIKEVDAILKYPRENYKLYAAALEVLIEYHKKMNNHLKEKRLAGIDIRLLKSRTLKFDQKYFRVLNRYLKLVRLKGTFKEMLWVKEELSEMLYAELQRKIETKTITENSLNAYGVQFKNSLNDYKRAEECYLLNMELNPGSSILCSNYALLLTSIKNEDDAAEELYLKSIKLDPLNDTAIGNYAFFLQNVRKKFTESEICYQESLQLNKTDRCNLANYASLKLIQGDIDEAKRLASKSLKLCIPEPNRFMARVLFLFIIIRMFECKSYDDLLGNMKFLFAYGMEHVTWDNRELMAFVKKILRSDECNLLQKIFNAINDYSCMLELNNVKELKDVVPLPFVTAYQSLLK